MKDTRASVSHDIRQVIPLASPRVATRLNLFAQLASVSSMLASAAPVEYRRGPLPPTLDPRQPKNQNLRRSADSQSPAVAHAFALQSSSNNNAIAAKAEQQHLVSAGGDSRPVAHKSFNDARSDANMAAVRERLANLSQSFAAANASASNMSGQVLAQDRAENKPRKPQKPAPNSVPLGRLRAEGSVGSLGSSVKGDDDWDEPDNGLLTLENFDQNGSSEGVILNSPRSVEVRPPCARMCQLRFHV